MSRLFEQYRESQAMQPANEHDPLCEPTAGGPQGYLTQTVGDDGRVLVGSDDDEVAC